MSCEFTYLDGSYVLGALSPTERQAFEKHLIGCAECARSVRELAGLPGLLARVDADVLESPPVEDPVPDTLLPALVQQVRRTQRRRTRVTVGLAAAAAVTVAVGSIAVTDALTGGAPTTSPAPSATIRIPAGQAMVPVGQAPVRASLAFESVAWGTRLDLTCTYLPDDDRYQPSTPPIYAMFVHTRDGRTEQVATWRSLPDKTMRLAAATAASLKDITSVEVRTAGGKPVLKLTV
jgi:Putative zinc-finger